MKFRLIFILFNVVLVVSFLVIYLMPLFMLGWDYTRVFWRNNWFLPIIFLVVIGVLNLYFALNWRLFRLLEREDWGGLVSYLEDRVLTRHRLRKQYVRILANGYLVNSRTDKLEELAAFLREHKPGLLTEFGVVFGIPYLLRNEAEEMEAYNAALLSKQKLPDRNWIVWNHAFALMLLGRREEARNELIGGAKREREPILLLLTLYLLDAYGESDEESERVVAEGKEALKGRFTPSSWQREVEKAKENVEVVILAKLIQEAGQWLFSFGVAEGREAAQ